MWGTDNWGEMIWQGAPQLPALGPTALLVLVAVLLVGGTLVMRRAHAPRWLMRLGGVVVVLAPLASYAARFVQSSMEP